MKLNIIDIREGSVFQLVLWGFPAFNFSHWQSDTTHPLCEPVNCHLTELPTPPPRMWYHNTPITGRDRCLNMPSLAHNWGQSVRIIRVQWCHHVCTGSDITLPPPTPTPTLTSNKPACILLVLCKLGQSHVQCGRGAYLASWWVSEAGQLQVGGCAWNSVRNSRQRRSIKMQ